MKFNKSDVFFFCMGGLLLAFAVMATSIDNNHLNKMKSQCEEKSGTFLRHERQCVKLQSIVLEGE